MNNANVEYYSIDMMCDTVCVILIVCNEDNLQRVVCNQLRNIQCKPKTQYNCYQRNNHYLADSDYGVKP